MKKRLFLILITTGLTLLACRLGALPVTPTAVPIPTIAAPTATPAPTATTDAVLPAATLFDVAWDDRSDFSAGLLEDERPALNRLPGASVYHLDVAFSADMLHLSGREEVRYVNQETVPLAEIYFRLYPNLLGGQAQVSALTVNNRPVQPELSLNDSALRVPLPSPLAPGQAVVVQMDFLVQIPTEPGINYGSFARLNGVTATPHIYPMIAVYDDDGWNVETPAPYGDLIYADAAFYRARITLPAGQIPVASGVELARQTGAQTQTVTYAAGPARDFYFAAGERYKVTARQVGATTIHSYAPPELAESAEMALDFAASALEIYNKRFGLYPFTELDLLTTPTSAGGIEYPGVIVVAQNLYENRGAFFEAATAHEVGHQWFYNVIGNDQVDDPWLDESLTQYVTWLYYRDRYGAEGDAGFGDSLQQRWDRLDRADIPIGRSVSTYDEKEYSAIVYGRGALFFDALAQQMEQAAFDAFLRDYYRVYKWESVQPDDFERLAETDCRCDLSTLFADWVYEK